MGFFETLRDRVSGKALRREVRFDDQGFVVTPYRRPAIFVEWAGICEIIAFKHDLFAYDEICIGCRTDDSDQYVWVGEDDDGFRVFRIEFERRYSIDPEWFSRIAQPPFAENRTTLWRRG